MTDVGERQSACERLIVGPDGLFGRSSRDAAHSHYSVLDAQFREKAIGNGFWEKRLLEGTISVAGEHAFSTSLRFRGHLQVRDHRLGSNGSAQSALTEGPSTMA